MQGVEVSPKHSFSIRGGDERRLVKQLIERFRQLSEEERSQLPALLNGLGKLQLGVGAPEHAKQTFLRVAGQVDEPMAKAEAFHNAYRAALEGKQWNEALKAISQASNLAPSRFAPFPMQRYRPTSILGAGGFGTAFLCEDTFFRNREVVVKVLHGIDLERQVEDVFAEAHTLSELNHPTIIGVFDCSYADMEKRSRPYLVMPYFAGVSLEQFVMERGTLSPKQLIAVARQVAAGMREAHARKILHRDLAPKNVLVRQQGHSWTVKIIDFGLAFRQQAIETSKAHSAGNTILSQSIAGTLKYAPPEQMGELRGVKSGPYSDVFAFGKTCCYALFRSTNRKRLRRVVAG